MNCSEINDWITAVVMGLFVFCILAMVYFAGVSQGINNFKDELKDKEDDKSKN